MEGEHDVDISEENLGRRSPPPVGRWERPDVQRDLRDLVSTGVLESVGRTRARYYTEGHRFPEAARTEARTPRAITNPYQG
jgi:hypothetical protein